jgi:hypothetical protein
MQRDEESGGSSQVQVYNHSRYWSFRLEILERFLMIRWLSLIVFLPTVVLAQSNPSAKIARQWRQQHEQAIVDEFVTLLSVPNPARSRKHPAQRGADRADDGKTRHRGEAGVGARGEPRGVRRNPHARRHAATSFSHKAIRPKASCIFRRATSSSRCCRVPAKRRSWRRSSGVTSSVSGR